MASRRRWADVHPLQFRTAIAGLCLALVCFVKGLDDHNDYLRLWHGCWHAFGAVFSYFSVKCNAKFDKRRTRLLEEAYGPLKWGVAARGQLLGGKGQ